MAPSLRSLSQNAQNSARSSSVNPSRVWPASSCPPRLRSQVSNTSWLPPPSLAPVTERPSGPFSPREAIADGLAQRQERAAARVLGDLAVVELGHVPHAAARGDMLAIGAQRALYEAGTTIPEQVAVASIDGSEEALYSTPSLTSVIPDKAAIASLAVKCLATRIRSEEPLPFEVHLAPHRLVVRESTEGVRRRLPP